MRPGPPPAFVRRLRAHNQLVLWGVLLSLAAATLAWWFLYQLGQGAVLAFLTFVHGFEITLPPSYPIWFAAGVIVLMLGGFAWRWLHPPGRPRDRSILGWHLLPETIFLPALLTLGISDHLAAWRKLTARRVVVAWAVLCEVLRRGRLREHEIGQLEFSPKRVLEAITTLQYCGLLDLHGSRDGWFYRVRSTEEPRCRDWLRAAGME
jgi:hypothetical protein